MRFGENFLAELKARVLPSDVVVRHVTLKRQGLSFFEAVEASAAMAGIVAAGPSMRMCQNVSLRI